MENFLCSATYPFRVHLQSICTHILSSNDELTLPRFSNGRNVVTKVYLITKANKQIIQKKYKTKIKNTKKNKIYNKHSIFNKKYKTKN